MDDHEKIMQAWADDLDELKKDAIDGRLILPKFNP